MAALLGALFILPAASGHPGYYAVQPVATYAVTYDGNGNDGGTVPTDEKAYPAAYTVTVIGNTGGLVREGYIFAGWNSAPDGSGSSLNMGNTFTITGDVTLFAEWEELGPMARSEPQTRANPVLANLSPADDIYHAAHRISTLVATFDQTIMLSGTGTVTVTDLDDGTDTETFTLPDPRVSSPNGNDLSIEMDGDLELNTRYSVRISSDAVTDFSGIDDDTTWNFRTVKTLINVVIATIEISDIVEGDDSGLPYKDIATCENVVFHDAINVDEAMRVASYGEIGLNLIQTIELQYLDITAQETDVGQLRIRAENDPAVQQARFRLFVMPRGLGGISGGLTAIGANWSAYKTFDYPTVLHELGHCLRGQHSNQDPGCVLGWASVNYAAEKKVKFGWLDNDNFPASPQSVVDVTSTTDLTLVPLSTHPEIIPGTRMARVFRPDGSRFNISYRVSSPPYSSLSSDIFSEKVSVRYDVNNTLTYEQASLAAGESHTNGFFRVTCQNVATDGSSADIRIEFVEPSMRFNPASAIVAEGADGATTTVTATVTLSHLYTETVTVQHALAASPGTGQDGVDYNYTPGTITFAPGETSQSFTFEVIDNALTDGDRTVIFEISPDTNVVAGTDINLTCTILDDEGNVAPVWDSNPQVAIGGAKDAAYTSSLADHASDSNGDDLSFAKVDGPDWLSVAADGSLSGTPGDTDTGLNTFTVSVTDRIAAPVEVSLQILIDSNAAPTFTSDPIATATVAVPGESYANTIAGSATDVNGDSLTYAKVSGPDWLSVAADGSLSGTPSNADIGVNSFTVSVSDGMVTSPTEAILNVTVIDRATGVTITQSAVHAGSSVYAPFDVLNPNSVLVAAIYIEGAVTEETLRFGTGGGSGDIAPDWVNEDADGRCYLAYWLNPPTDSGLAIRSNDARTSITAIWELANVDPTAEVVKSIDSATITTLTDHSFIIAAAGMNGDLALTAAAASDLNTPLRYQSVTLGSLGLSGGGTLSGGDTMAGSTGTYNVDFEGQNFDGQGFGPIALAFSPGGTPLSHPVTYDGNGSDGGTVPDDPADPYANGATVTVLDNNGNLVRNGYTFDGWNSAADGSGTEYAPGETFDILTATTLYAQWLGTPYTVSFDANGGDTPVPSSKTVNFESSYGSLATSSRTGYTFAGWFTAASGGSEVTDATTVTTSADHSLYARWTVNPYTITFDSAGGTAVAPITQNYDTAVSAPADPTRGGYVFTGWSPSLPATMPAANLTVTAQWDLGTPQVSVSASDAAASETGPDTGSWTITRAGDTAPALEVYFSLSGTATLTDDYTLDATSPVTIAAGESSVTVTLTPVDDTEVEGGDETAILTIDSNAAYTIGMAAAAISIADNEPVTLLYDGNGSDGGTVPAGSSYSPGSTVTVAGNPGLLIRGGYSFAGWNTVADGSGILYAENDTFTMTGNLTLYAQWRTSASIAWITDQVSINSGWQSMLEAAGHSVTYFGAGYASLDATEAATLNAYDLVIASGDADLGTGWERVSVPMINMNPYRINELGWSSNEGDLKSQGTSVSVLDTSDPIWKGMGLSNGDSVQLWTSNVRFNGNALGYLLGNASHIASKSGDSNDVGIVRWGTGDLPDGEGPRLQWRSSAGTDSDAFTLTAAGQTAFLNAIDDFIRPEALTYSVTYDGNGSDGGSVPVDDSAYVSGATVVVLGNTGSLTRTGYTFAAWNADTGGTGTAYAPGATFTIEDNTTLYAHWTLINDTTAPALLSTTPSDEASTVTRNGNLVATFDEAIVLMSGGTVTLTDETDGSSTVTITLPDPQVTAVGTDLIIDPAVDLEPSTLYSVQISSNAVEDLAATPNAYGGIADNSSWNFTTESTTVAYWQLDEASGNLVDVVGARNLAGASGLTYLQTALVEPVPNPDGGPFSSGAPSANPNSILFPGGHTGPKTTDAAPVKITTTNSFTFEGWLQTTTTASQAVIAGDRHSSTGWKGWYFLVSGTTGKLQFYSNFAAAAAILSDTVVNDGNPHHFAIVWDHVTGEMRLYVDGNLEDTVSQTPDSYTQSAGFGIGARATGSDNLMNDDRFAGSLDELRLSKVALAPSQFLNATTPYYTVTYDGNSSDGGSVPTDALSPYESGATVTVLDNTGGLTRSGYNFAGWNTNSAGTGTAYAADDTFTIAGDTTLYAQWTVKPALTITAASNSKVYDGTPLTDSGYSLSAGTLEPGHSLVSVSVSGSQTNAGSSDNVPGNALIEDGSANDVTSFYAITYANGTLTVTQATPTATAWPTATSIGLGQALSASTLSGGDSSTPGVFAFTSPATIPEGVGIYTAAVTFTPTDSTNFTGVPGTVDVEVIYSSYLNFVSDNVGTSNNPAADGNNNGVEDGLEYAFYQSLGDGVKLDSSEKLGQVRYGMLDEMGTPNDPSDDRISYAVLLPANPPADVTYRVYASSVAPRDSGKTLLATYSGGGSGSWTMSSGASMETGPNAEDVIVDPESLATTERRFIWVEIEIATP